MDGILVIDPGSSLTKIFYRHSGDRTNYPRIKTSQHHFLMNAGVEEITEASYQLKASDTVFGGGLDSSVVHCLGRYWAIANQPGNDGRVRKVESAIVKTLALIGHISKDLPVADSGIDLSLGVLLPFDEYGDRDEFIRSVQSEVQNFGFQGESLSQVRIKSIRVVPEGYGLFRSERSQLMGVLICGHRDISWLHVTKGRPIAERCRTFAGGGFRKFLQILSQSFPIKDELLTTQLISTMPATKQTKKQAQHFGAMLRSPDEVARLISAIENSKKQYWNLVSSWLSRTSYQEVSKVAINGGSSPFLNTELKRLIPSAAWGNNSMRELQTEFDVGDQLMLHRLCDSYSLFKVLGGNCG